MDSLSFYLLLGFALAICFAVIASYGNFCTMGAVSDWVNMGELGRVRSWSLAVGVAMLTLALANAQGWLDLSLVASGESSPTPYLVPEVRWVRNLFGGLLFGVGMTLAGGCSSKNLLRTGGGDLKALVALLALGGAAWLSVYTESGSDLLAWLGAPRMDMLALGAETQSIASLVEALLPVGEGVLHLWLPVAVGLVFILFALAGASFRAERHLWVAGLGIGLIVLLGWWLSAGNLGMEALEESDFSDQPTLSMGAQSLSFTLPIGQAGYYLLKGAPMPWLTLGVVMAFGVVFGGSLYALVTRSFRFQWFHSLSDFVNHVVGGLLMGFGGVAAMGCTVGQGLSGVSTLAIGSFLALAAIAIGCVLTLRFRLYKMVYEDASSAAIVLTALAESRLLPAKFRRLEKV